MATRLTDPVDRMAYRGYYLRKSLSTDTWYVSKDNAHITSAPSLDAAKREVDGLVDGGAR